ncbi:26S proteasome non-ATPase regulatory subunit 14-like [Camellia sinensis]|uniref:26S proteasome non-ATPase regulatory subunit 14-like n=1 Tax=Camellia sinensis TaxID=4442 RepID=UPI001036E8AA|nr:26S proteasome non-ATPase regulatory subunit 14-like [Camellia sinensis]
MQAQPSAPSDMKCKDKFLIQSTVVPFGTTEEDITPGMYAKDSGKVAVEVLEMLNLAIKYNKAMQEEDELPPEKLAIANVGRQDAKKHLEEHVSKLMSSSIIQTLVRNGRCSSVLGFSV